MLTVDKTALRVNCSVMIGMCNSVNNILDSKTEIADTDLINLAGSILSMAHWIMQSGFINTPEPKEPEPLKELQED